MRKVGALISFIDEVSTREFNKIKVMLRFFKRNVVKEVKREVVDYTIVAANSSMLLRERVREHVKRGWEPNGGPVYNFDEHTMMQGMVKYEY